MHEVAYSIFCILAVVVTYIWEQRYNSRAKRIRDESISHTSPLALLLLFAPVLERILTHGSYELPPLSRIIGILLLVFGVAVRVSSHRTWLRIISRKQVKNDKLGVIAEGMYQHVRHPMWLGFYSMTIGLYLAASTLLGLLCLFAVWLPMGIWQIRAEEKRLVELFGDTYEKYRSQRNCILPPVW